MKKLVITTEKGGVGKTALTVQLAFYLALRLRKRVLVLDLDVQNNTSLTIKTQGSAQVASFTTYDVLTSVVETVPNAQFLLVPEGNRETLDLESRGADAHTAMMGNLLTFLEAADGKFDVCLMDTGPRADICHNVALMTADFFVAPLILSQHAIEGVADILYSKPWGYEFIRDNVNDKLELIGILPVMVEAKPVQQSVLQVVEAHPHISPFLLKLADQSVAKIPRLQAVEEAQNTGAFIADMKKTSARDAWKQIQPVFDAIISKLQLEK